MVRIWKARLICEFSTDPYVLSLTTGDDISSSSNDQLLVDTGITSRQKRNKNPPLLDKFVAWMPVDIFAEVSSLNVLTWIVKLILGTSDLGL